jgi:uncharacterized protein (DUF2236 family)
MDSFLRAHQNYSRAEIPGGADSYVRLWGKSVEPLGLDQVPTSEAELVKTLAEYGPQLRADHRTKSVIRWIKKAPLPTLAKPVYALLFQAALASLPRDLQQMTGMRALPLWFLRPLVTNLLRFMRFAIGPDSPIEDAALRRLERAGIIS